ncbi:AH receptor-interacting protein-like [Panonychus citri]|uniref:AH receptor-interacting protein-like n=1 Tax=Panonychus citri TaxID=50023 RepID=UPI0023076295|nr:AH receptor-interacting protein-like [Panonychus citri]XP_053207596.1 AH receptor-interacting protein-like [Panonychus citri]
MKGIIYPGKGEIPEFSLDSKAIFHFQTIRIINGEEKIIDDSRKLGKPMELLIGKKFKLEIWESLVKTMRIGEVARFHCRAATVLNYPFVSKQFRKFASNSGNQRENDHGDHSHESHCCGMALQKSIGHDDLDELIKSPSDLDFIIELIDVISHDNYEKEIWQMSSEEQLKQTKELKEKGNQAFRLNNYQEASNFYEKALAILEQLILKEKPGDEEWISLDKMRIPFYSNLAQCKLNLSDYYGAKRACDEVINREPTNVKAWFRRGKANLEIGEFDLAVGDFDKSAILDPNLQQSVSKLKVTVEKERKATIDSERSKFAGKLFGKSTITKTEI